MNPVIDKSTQADRVLPNQKNRCDTPVYEPGGGGINVSRALRKLGHDSTAWYLAGGKSGDMLADLLAEEEIVQRKFDTEQDIRENLMVFDKSTGGNYRFTMAGPEFSKSDWKEIIAEIENLDESTEYLVGSGSLPPGVPEDFYARLAAKCRSSNIKFILDTSGPALKKALEEGVYMIKPNFREMVDLLGKKNITGIEMEKEAKEFIKKNSCEVIILSLGPKGSMLIREGKRPEYIIPPEMPVNSAVGAGDSMVGGVLAGLVKGLDISEAAAYGVAAGTAATLTEGSQLCTKADTEDIFNWLKSSRKINEPDE